MTEMEITYVFIRYMLVTIQRQSKMFYKREFKINYIENNELNEKVRSDKETMGCNLNFGDLSYFNYEENLTNKESLYKGFSLLSEWEKYIICEKYFNKRSDADIGKEFSISGQMISRRRRQILNKLKNSFAI